MADRTNEPKTYSDRFKTVDSFKTSYWSGVDVSLYCGDIWIDDALQFGVQTVEQANPYYGYASYSADRIHHGVRILTGEFTVNYRHSNYIYAVLQEVTRNHDNPAGTMIDLPINYNPVIGAGTVTGAATPEDDVRSYVEFAKNYSKLRQAQDDSAARALNSAAIPQMTPFGPIFHGPRKGFTLTVLFGAQMSHSLLVDFDWNSHSKQESPVSTKNPGPATGFRLLGVSLTGANLMINDSGQPVMETYNFIARDVRTLTGADIFGYTDSKPRS